MSNVMIAGSNPSLVEGTVGASGTLSQAFDLSGYTLAGLTLDNATAGTLSFLVSHTPLVTNGTLTNNFKPVYNSDGTVYSIQVPAASVAFSATIIVNAIAPYQYVRLQFSTAQSNSPTCRFVVKA